MRNRQQPLDEWKPAIEVALHIRVGKVEPDRLLLVGGRVAIVHQREVHADPVREPEQLEIPVVPPTRILLTEQDHQERRQEQQPADSGADRPGVPAGTK